MTHTATRDDFLRECLSRPLDMTARLVFADWLEECGQWREARHWRGSLGMITDDVSAGIMGHISRAGIANADELESVYSQHRNGFRGHMLVLMYHGFIVMGNRSIMLTDLGRVVLAAWELSRVTESPPAEPELPPAPQHDAATGHP